MTRLRTHLAAYLHRLATRLAPNPRVPLSALTSDRISEAVDRLAREWGGRDQLRDL